MKRTTLIAGAALAVVAAAALAFTSAYAKPSIDRHETAIGACSTVNPLQPVQVVNAVDDGSGIGFSLVWLTDKNNNLWLCDADDEGNVYSYSLVTKDLLEGDGLTVAGITEVDLSEMTPQEVAEKVCVGWLDGGGQVAAIAPDGFEQDPGFAIFVKNEAGNIYLCNATGNAAIWAFEPIGDPLSFGQQTS
jgi:hypothetical protein